MTMETRSIGSTGLRVSLVGVGCNQFGGRLDFDATKKVVDHALDLGINHFDTADIYGNRGRSEELLGRALGARRKDVVLVTKFGKPMSDAPPTNRGGRTYVMQAVEASLKRLKTDWIDLLFMHEPDPSTPIEETFRAIEEMKKAGKVRHLAASNFSAAEIIGADAAADRLKIEGLVACQDELSLLERKIERDLVPAMEKLKLALIPYFPLSGGALSGKYRKGKPIPEGRLNTGSGVSERFLGPAKFDKVEKLAAFADARGHTLLELAMSWLAQHKLVVSIITGATKPEQLDANVKAVGWKLTADELTEVDRITG
jgi:aryl-alcohol dehydrogenase-like predicted oxidoreductase